MQTSFLRRVCVCMTESEWVSEWSNSPHLHFNNYAIYSAFGQLVLLMSIYFFKKMQPHYILG